MRSLGGKRSKRRWLAFLCGICTISTSFNGLRNIFQPRRRRSMVKPRLVVSEMSKTRKPPAQMALFAGKGEIHGLGLLGWEDALWSKKIEVPLLNGKCLTLDLATIRRSHREPSSSAAPASNATKTRNR